jgi:S1-C subfamily serine protease
MTEDAEQPDTPSAPEADDTALIPPASPVEGFGAPQEASGGADGPTDTSEPPAPEEPAPTAVSHFALPPIVPASEPPTEPPAPIASSRFSSYTPPAPVRPSWPFPVVEPGPPTAQTAPTEDPAEGSRSYVSYRPTTPPALSGPAPTGGKGRRWIAVAIIAAVIGALVGSGVTALTDHNGSSGSNVTIHESNAAPGAAVLSGNVTIPQLVKEVIPAVVSIDVKAGGNEDEGTGMIITSNGEVITNNHVIELYTESTGGTITITEYGQSKANPATLLGYDAQKDVALLRIDNASNLHTITFGSSAKTQVGDAVVAIGNALGLAAGTPTVTQGIVSALGRSVTAGGDGTATENLQNMVQTDAAINPGNSGGPLIDTAGQVIGMNTAVAGSDADGTSSQNIGFAIPIAQVESLIPELEKGGPATNQGGYLGVDITTLTSAMRAQYGFTPTSGAVILTVISGSPADKAGLQQGDIIVAIGNKQITTSEGLQSAIQNDKAGQSISVTYYVGNEKHTVSVTLGSQLEEQQQESQQQSTELSPFGGGGFSGGDSFTIP